MKKRHLHLMGDAGDCCVEGGCAKDDCIKGSDIDNIGELEASCSEDVGRTDRANLYGLCSMMADSDFAISDRLVMLSENTERIERDEMELLDMLLDTLAPCPICRTADNATIQVIAFDKEGLLEARAYQVVCTNCASFNVDEAIRNDNLASLAASGPVRRTSIGAVAAWNALATVVLDAYAGIAIADTAQRYLEKAQNNVCFQDLVQQYTSGEGDGVPGCFFDPNVILSFLLLNARGKDIW